MAGVKGMKGGGGRRPGAGRKALPEGQRKVQVTVTLTAEQKADMDFLRSMAVDTNAVIGRELHRRAVALELAESGIA